MRTGARGAVGLVPAVVSAVAFGGSGPLAKPLIDAGIDPLQVAWLRVTGAAVVLAPLVVMRMRRRVRAAPRRRPGAAGVRSRRGWLRMAGYGLFAVAGVQACYFLAVSRIPVGVALLIEYVAPVLVLCWTRFVRRTPVSRHAVVGACLAVAGLAAVVEIWSGLRFDALGVAFAACAACCEACYFLLPTTEQDSGGGGAFVAQGLLVGGVALTALARPWRLPWAVLGSSVPLAGYQVPAPVVVAWICLVATVLAYLTGIAAIRALSAHVAGVVGCLEAVVAAVAAWLLLGQHLSVAQCAGGVLVVIGAATAQWRRSPPDRRADGPVRGDPCRSLT